MSYALQFSEIVHDKEMQVSLRNLAILQKKDVNEITRKWGGTMGRYLAVWTKPMTGNAYNTGADARISALNQVTRAINHSYMDVRSLYKKLKGKDGTKRKKMVRIIAGMIRRGEDKKAEEILHKIPFFKTYRFNKFDDGKRHKQVRRGGKMNDVYVVTDHKKLSEYIKKKREMVGFTKAAWINAARQVTGKTPASVGKWVSKHTNSPGFGSFTIQGPIGMATLSSRLPWASDTLNESLAFKELQINLRSSLQHALDYHLKKEQRKK